MRCDGDERHELHLQTSEQFVLRFNVFTEHLFYKLILVLNLY